jgi:molybdenum cofactor cytidylyltransferase
VSKGESPSVYAIVLAAGASTRFGSPKQCAQLGGETLIRRAISAATEAVGPAIRVVLGAHAAAITATLDLQEDQIVLNTEWSEGMASSIRLGVARLPATCAGTVFLLADQPYVNGVSLGRLISAWRDAPEYIVASRFGSVIGAPCLFPRWCFGELSALQGDQGARSVLERHSEWVLAADHPEAGIDIDTPQQLAEQQALIQIRTQSDPYPR